jgi:hypothetical protein
MARCDSVLARRRNCFPSSSNVPSDDCGIIASTIVVPELEIYTRRFIVTSVVNKFGVPFPPELPPPAECLCYPSGSFISMLFDECYDLDYYKYLYKEVEDKLSWPSVVRRRLNIYPISARYMILDDAGSNLFVLQADDFTLLDALLAYRQDSTSVVVIDSTATVSLVYDSTSDLTTLTASVNGLSTELSKLIFIYLDLMINKNISNYNTLTPISTDYSLQTIYEMFIIDKYFEFVSCNAIDVRLGAMDPTYSGTPYDPSGGPPGSNPPGGTSEECDPTPAAPNPSILQYS